MLPASLQLVQSILHNLMKYVNHNSQSTCFIHKFYSDEILLEWAAQFNWALLL